MRGSDVDLLSEVVFRFFSGLDQHDHRSVAQLMARKGTWHRQGVQLVGPEAVLTALEQRDPKRHTAHLVSNLRVETVGENSARLRYYMTAFESVADANQTLGPPKMAGVRDCTDDLILEDGHWRIGCKRSQLLLPAM